jgi:hypothetical protein
MDFFGESVPFPRQALGLNDEGCILSTVRFRQKSSDPDRSRPKTIGSGIGGSGNGATSLRGDDVIPNKVVCEIQVFVNGEVDAGRGRSRSLHIVS